MKYDYQIHINKMNIKLHEDAILGMYLVKDRDKQVIVF